MVDNIIVARTLLTLYRKVDGYIELHWKKIQVTTNYAFEIPMSCEEISEKVIRQLYKRNNLKSLKNKIEIVLSKLPEKYQTVIRFYFFVGLTSKTVASRIKRDERTVFRQLGRGIQLFADNLLPEFNSFVINELLKQHRFILREYWDTRRAFFN
ncbi:MAG: hypothetical protein FWE16_03985 [Firmicutes bacterium]|nr:hypothetical protein [Bacillota bacterium]